MENEQHQGPNLETEIASYKNSTVARKTTSRRLKHFLGFVKHFSGFAEWIHETCDRSFFNLAIIILVIVFFSGTIHIIFTFS